MIQTVDAWLSELLDYPDIIDWVGWCGMHASLSDLVPQWE